MMNYITEEGRGLNTSYRQEETNKTPTKRTGTPSKRTPKVHNSPPKTIHINSGANKVQGDRFIPSVDTDLEINHFNLTKENSSPNPEFSSPAKAEFANALENTLFSGKINGKVSLCSL
jgi:hypothetical protein